MVVEHATHADRVGHLHGASRTATLWRMECYLGEHFHEIYVNRDVKSVGSRIAFFKQILDE